MGLCRIEFLIVRLTGALRNESDTGLMGEGEMRRERKGCGKLDPKKLREYKKMFLIFRI
jgi:hypothetical protein